MTFAAEEGGCGSARAAGDRNHRGACEEGKGVSSKGQPLVLNCLAKGRCFSVQDAALAEPNTDSRRTEATHSWCFFDHSTTSCVRKRVPLLQ